MVIACCGFLEGDLGLGPPQIPDARQSAILLLLLIGTRDGTTRVRLSETTLKRLWKRNRLKDEFLDEVGEWLARGGWALFFAKTTFAAVKTGIVVNWPRLSSKRLDVVLDEMEEGGFDFEGHANLVSDSNDDTVDD
jgi:hypothetical protein